MWIDVGKSNVNAGHGHGAVIVNTDCLECMPSFGWSGCCTHSSVVPLLADCIRPIDIHDSREGILGVCVICISVKRDWMLNLDLSSSTNHLNVWRSIENNNIENAFNLVLFLIGNGDFNRVLSVVCPRPIQHTINRLDASPCCGSSPVVPRNVEQT